MAKTKERPVTTGKTLREIADEKQVLETWIAEQEGELTPELEALLADHEADATVKIEAMARYIGDEEGRIEVVERELARLTARKAAMENRIDRLKNHYIARELDRLGYGPGDAVRTALITVRVQLNNPKLIGDEPNEATLITWAMNDRLAKYVRFTPETYALDRVTLLTDAKITPALLPGTMKIVRDESVRIA
jgi:hypothetical protein